MSKYPLIFEYTKVSAKRIELITRMAKFFVHIKKTAGVFEPGKLKDFHDFRVEYMKIDTVLDDLFTRVCNSENSEDLKEKLREKYSSIMIMTKKFGELVEKWNSQGGK